MTYTEEEMIKALEKAGYEIKLEVIDTSVDLGAYSVKREVEINNVYYKGRELVNWGYLRNYRLEYVFKMELSKRLLKLF